MCADCGGEIGYERLRANPGALRCICLPDALRKDPRRTGRPETLARGARPELSDAALRALLRAVRPVLILPE